MPVISIINLPTYELTLTSHNVYSYYPPLSAAMYLIVSSLAKMPQLCLSYHSRAILKNLILLLLRNMRDVRGGLTTMCFSTLPPSNVSGDISSEKL